MPSAQADCVPRNGRRKLSDCSGQHEKIGENLKWVEPDPSNYRPSSGCALLDAIENLEQKGNLIAFRAVPEKVKEMDPGSRAGMTIIL